MKLVFRFALVPFGGMDFLSEGSEVPLKLGSN
jgi:hypothetical protein